MNPEISPFLEKVTLLGGGDHSEATVSRLLTLAPNLVVCDGAAAQALALGHVPGLVVGDMDSLDAATRAALDPATVVEIGEQDTTDFDKALRSIDAPMVLGAGFMGQRLDHELACYNALVRRPEARCILVGEHDICFHCPPEITLELTPGDRVSLFPLREVAVSIAGLVWSFERIVFAPDGRVGTSNAAAERRVTIRPESHGLLVILPAALLEAAIAGLEAAPPAPKLTPDG
ncbi:thiamine diphosphokinase [Maritimibacter sp. DP1N21-5]|uniref:thiamine diphosphokinase n=1 Tax=Maritimibacter sp. DP1N21-5 TaxID=2836867 RepID=UPI001C4436EE|nr:thiamine diphosphokinase [Maritimibacter sp. DP1N21-5]MBV7410259.1 thiamine diphosphokinase [Maritimibacter sp. DP1N21-5]